MKTLILTATVAAIALAAAPGFARVSGGDAFAVATTADSLDKRRKPRIKGGSGCDSAGDIREHAACR